MQNLMYLCQYKYGHLYFPSKKIAHRYLTNTDISTYQEYINTLCERYARSDSKIIDIGANCGIFTVSFSKLFQNSEIHCFEAVPYVNTFIRENIKYNHCNNVIHHEYGLGSTEGNIDINFSEIEPGWSSMSRKLKNSTLLSVPIKTLDSLNLTNVSFMKIDVEQYESEVLAGATETLKVNDMKIIAELPKRNKAELKNHRKSTNILHECGFIYKKKVGGKDYIFSKTSFEEIIV